MQTPTQLSVSVQPSLSAQNAVAIPQQPQLRLRDAAGKLTGKAGVVVTATVGTGATLTGANATTDINGTATFSTLTITGTVGTYTVHFAASGLTGVDVTGIVLTPGVPAQLAIGTAPSVSAQAGVALAAQPAIQLKDVSGNLVSQAGVTVTAALVSGTPTLSNATAQTSAAGLATFSGLTLSGVTGSYTLRFSSGSLTPASAAAPTVLAAGPATQLSITTQPSATLSNGAALTTQPVIQMKDAFGNNATQAGVSVVATIVAGPAGPPAPVLAGDTAVTDASGKATFAVLGITGLVGSYSLRFAAANLASVVSSGTALTAGAATKFTLTTQPSAAVQSGAALTQQPVIQMRDVSGNAVKVAGVVVTASVVAGTATLSNATATTDTLGTATFAGLSISAVIGSYTLTFAAPALSNVNAAAATVVSPGQAATVSLTTQPATTGVVAVVLSRQPVVQLRDGAGNAVAQAGVVVTASVVSGSVTIANATATTIANGSATFSGMTLTALVGSYTLRFSAPSLTAANAAAVTALSVGAAAQLALTRQPSASARNDSVLAVQPVVQVRDAGGNPVNANGVAVTASAGGATVLQSGATTNASGTATFSNLTLLGQVGTYTLSFNAAGLQTATASGVTVLGAGDPISLTIVTGPPVTARSGVAFAQVPVIDARDTSGNLVPGATIVAGAPGVHITVINGTQVTNAQGRATFTGLALSGAVSGYSMQFCVGACPSASVVVGSPTPTSLLPGPIASVIVTAQPSTSAINGSVLVTPPVVHVADASGNAIDTVVTVTTSAGVALGSASVHTDVFGDAAFSALTLTGTTGSYTLNFNAGAVSSAAGAPTVLAAGPPATITINTAPSVSATNGFVFATVPVVTVTDVSGNAIGNLAVTTSVLPAGASLSSGSATTNVGGVATFPGMGLVGALGTYTITFHAGSVNLSAPATTLGAGAAAGITITTQPSTSASNGSPLAQQPVIHVVDGSNNPVANAIVTAVAPGATVRSGTTTTNGSGDAIFTALNLVGTPSTYTLQFQSGAVSVSAAAATTLSIGTASMLVLQAQPSTTARSGIALGTQPVVQVTDAGGALLTGVTPTVVTASVVSGTVTLASATATTSSGVATFSGLALSALTGSYTLVFSAPGLQSALAASPTVLSPGVAADLQLVTQPSNSAITDSTFAVQPVVQVRDGAGNFVDTAGVNVTVSSSKGSPVFLGVTTIPTNASGRATFSGLAVHPAGAYQLQFSAPSLPVRAATDSLVVATIIANSVPDSNLAGGPNSAQSLVIKVLPGDTILTVVLSGSNQGNGDADLYVRFGAAPDIANGIFDCFPNLAGNNEVCTFRNPTPGLWYASIFAFFSFGHVTVTAFASGH